MTKAETFNGILAIIGLVANIMGIVSFVAVSDAATLEYSHSLLNVITFYSTFVITWLLIRKKYSNFLNGESNHRPRFSIVKTSLLVNLVFLPIHFYISVDGFLPFFNFLFFSVIIAGIIKYMMPTIFEDMQQFLTREGNYISTETFICQYPFRVKVRPIKKGDIVKIETNLIEDLFTIILGSEVSGYMNNNVDDSIEVPLKYFWLHFKPLKETQTND
jgi:hypothetical protein